MWVRDRLCHWRGTEVVLVLMENTNHLPMLDVDTISAKSPWKKLISCCNWAESNPNPWVMVMDLKEGCFLGGCVSAYTCACACMCACVSVCNKWLWHFGITYVWVSKMKETTYPLGSANTHTHMEGGTQGHTDIRQSKIKVLLRPDMNMIQGVTWECHF